jgi:membrane associated rhomboid family serine protease
MKDSKPKISITRELKNHVLILSGFVLLAWGVELFDLFVLKGGSNLRGGLDAYGIIPRNPIGLRGILFAPFLHHGLGHLISNTLPFITLGWLIMLRGTSDFFVVSIIAGIVGGLGTWIFGSRGIHIGASGVIFGYLGYLLARGYFERSMSAIAMSLFVCALYGSLIWGISPFQPYGNISWEGHLFGFIGGIISAKMLASDRRQVGN